MRIPTPSLPHRKPKAVPVLRIAKNSFEIVLRSQERGDLVKSALKLMRTPGVSEVLVTSESGRDARWRVVASNPEPPDMSDVGEIVPHASQVSDKARSKGGYIRTARGTWRVAMQLVPVVAEGAERTRMAQYRGNSGYSVWISRGVVTVGFVLESATPKDGTQICQSSLLNMAAKVGVRCEVVPEPRFAALVDNLSTLKV